MLTDKKAVKVLISMLMEKDMKVNGIIIKNMVKVSCTLATEKVVKVNG